MEKYPLKGNKSIPLNSISSESHRGNNPATSYQAVSKKVQLLTHTYLSMFKSRKLHIIINF